MFNYLLGAATASAIFWLIGYVRRKNIKLNWWQWLLTILGVFYAIFVAAVTAGLLEEHATQGAVVMGTMLGLLGLIWGGLVNQFFFKKQLKGTE